MQNSFNDQSGVGFQILIRYSLLLLHAHNMHRFSGVQDEMQILVISILYLFLTIPF